MGLPRRSIKNPTGTQSYSPSIAAIGGVPYVAWSGEDGTTQALSVKRFDGSAWQPVGGSLNTDPSHYSSAPNITDVGGFPVVTWSEDTATNYLLYAKRFEAPAGAVGATRSTSIPTSMRAT